MHVVEPRKRDDGKWEMVVRGISPRINPISICLEDGGNDWRSEIGKLKPCEGHQSSVAARGCAFAKKWAQRIELHGDTVIGALKPKEQ